jgi:hypothetical protein
MLSPSSNNTGDELEMDNYAIGGRVSDTNTVIVSVTAIPGPVSNTRYFNLIIG